MRKTFFFLALGLLVAISANAVEKKVYSYYNSSTKTLTFTYDDQYDSRSNVEYYTGSSDRRFSGYETEVTSIVVDQSLETLHRASWARLFYAGGSGTTEYHLSKVTSITGLQYIKTDMATDLTGMFNGLESIESIDVSTFNTSKVISTSWLFGSCKKLKTINLGDMDITALTNTTFMFGYCNALEKIYCTTDFSASTTLSTSTSMFYATSKLVGGNGTKYVSSKQDKAYARPDRGTTSPGYFSYPDAIQNTVNLIYAIGTVEYTTECYNKIQAAAAAYTALTDEQKAYITEDKKILNKALTAYYALDAKHIIGDIGSENTNAYLYAQTNEYTEVYNLGKTNEIKIIACYNAVTTSSTMTEANAKIEEAKGYYESTVTALVAAMKAAVCVDLHNLSKEGDSDATKAIISNAIAEVNAFTWDYDKSANDNTNAFDTQFSYSWYMDVKTAVANQRQLEQNIEKLYAAISDLTALRMFADNYLENAEIVASINTDINNAYAVYNNPSATLAEVTAALKNATDAIESYKALMMPMAKEQLKADLNALLKEGDPQACKDIVAAAVAQVDVIIVWDNTKTAAENILALAAAGESLFNTTKEAVEKARQETAIDAIVGSAVKDAKIIRNGHLLIQRGNELFNAQGARVE